MKKWCIGGVGRREEEKQGKRICKPEQFVRLVRYENVIWLVSFSTNVRSDESWVDDSIGHFADERFKFSIEVCVPLLAPQRNMSLLIPIGLLHAC